MQQIFLIDEVIFEAFLNESDGGPSGGTSEEQRRSFRSRVTVESLGGARVKGPLEAVV
jgi:hypothetical protein